MFSFPDETLSQCLICYFQSHKANSVLDLVSAFQTIADVSAKNKIIFEVQSNEKKYINDKAKKEHYFLNLVLDILTFWTRYNIYGLLTKREVKMAGYWPSSFFACLWTETKSRSINTQKKNEANIQPFGPNKLGQ